MYLNIPTKLEIYFNQIKEHTKYIHAKDKFTLIKLGETKNTESMKLMYMIYNPFPTSIKIDCNSFTKDSYIYKMYPTEFTLNSDTVCAFVCFVSQGNNIKFDEHNFLTNIRQMINTKLNRLNDLEISEFKRNNFIKIEPQAIDFEQTVLLNSYLNDMEDLSSESSLIKFNSEYDDQVDVLFEEYQVKEDSIDFVIKFKNKSDKLNFMIQSFRLKIYDKDTKIIIDVKSEFQLKALSLKNTTLQIPKEKVAMIDLEKLKLKITIL